VALQTVQGRTRAESAEDLATWLSRLTGCPQVTRTAVLGCGNPVHGGEVPNWFYVDADGVARHRCVGCGNSVSVLDSEEHWTHPPAWSCRQCGNCIAELATGLAEDNGVVRWIALAVRCVECGGIEGVTDMHVNGVPAEQALAAL
jgi:hypothetical protein